MSESPEKPPTAVYGRPIDDAQRDQLGRCLAQLDNRPFWFGKVLRA